MAAGSATQNANRSVQVFQDVFQDPTPPIPAISPIFINSEFLLKSGQNTRRGYKKRAPLSELNDKNTAYPEKQKVGRPKKSSL